MKITFRVPDWALGSNINIFAGRELLGVKRCLISHEDGKHVSKYLPLEIKPKEGRCTGCGECCKGCPFSTPTGCMLGSRIPYSCLRSVCTNNFAGCTEILEVVE